MKKVNCLQLGKNTLVLANKDNILKKKVKLPSCNLKKSQNIIEVKL